jgi:dTDP-4-amino-4,6-dideoxygalactose transaminase
MNTKIWLSPPHMCGSEQHLVQEVFNSNWIAPLGPMVDAFEQQLAKHTNTKAVAALSSGTSALHLALILLGVGQNDTVICQSLTFSASANPIVYQGAQPIFIDSEPETWNMCPNALEQALKTAKSHNKLPKAIIVVHLYGMPANMQAIQALADQYEVPIIEDAAEALGSTYCQQACGGLGAFGVLSFNGNKIITTSGGGALVSNNEQAIAQARFLATQARDLAPHYQHTHIGYNYRLSNVLAAIGVGQMQVIQERVQKRRALFETYQKALSHLPGWTFQPEPMGHFSNRWLTCVLIDPNQSSTNTQQLRLHLESLNIESRPLWKPMHRQPVFEQYDYVGGQIAEGLFHQGLCLPSGSSLTADDQERVIAAILDHCKA